MEKKVILRSIELSHFRGQNRRVDFNDDLTTISGQNGCGKSTILSAWLWLMTSYTSASNVKNFNLFDNREEISPDTPKASVKATLEIDGLTYTIEKTAEAKFTRKRGSDTYEKASSDVYTIKLDNIETTATAFYSWVENNICSLDLLPFCLDGHFFTELIDDKPRARKILEAIVGEVKREDMKGDYSAIDEDMKRYSVENIEERTKNELKPLRARLAEVPAIIDSKLATLAEYSTIDYNALLAEIENKKGEIEEIDNKILGEGKAIEPILGRRDDILDIINLRMMELNDKRALYIARESAEINALLNKIEETRKMNATIEVTNLANHRRKANLLMSIERYEGEIQRLLAKREALLADRDAVKARVFTAQCCSYCGQELPEDMMDEARERFNEMKAKDLEDIVVRGKNNNCEIDSLKQYIANAREEIDMIPAPAVIVDISGLEKQLSVDRKSVV